MASADTMSTLYRRFKVFILSCALLACGVAQRAGFKIAGYTLGGKPFVMIMIVTVSSLPINSVPYFCMVFKTGGVLPEYRTWRYLRDYWIIATMTTMNGIGIMWANPFVEGYKQALMSSVAIPLTMALSTICFGTRYSVAAVMGVFLIVCGVLKVSWGGADSADADISTKAPTLWACIFAASQFPLSAASVYQEFAFQKSLNMLHFVHYLTIFLTLNLVICIPLETSFGSSSSLADLFSSIMQYTSCIIGMNGPPECKGAGHALAVYIICMNINNYVQALLIKSAGATWTMIVVSLGTPLGALAFSCPWIVGVSYVEELNTGIYLSTVLVTAGVLVYRLGSVSGAPQEEKELADVDETGYKPLDEGNESVILEMATQTDITVGPKEVKASELAEIFLKCEGYGPPRPAVVSAGLGLFSNEYTNATGNAVSLFEEKTFAELNARKSIPGRQCSS